MLRIFLLFFIISHWYWGLEAAQGESKKLNRALQSFIQKNNIPVQELGFWMGLPSDKGKAYHFITRNHKKKFKIASLTKLFVGLTAFEELGLDARFKTQVFSDKAPKNFRVKDIYLVGGGDPSLVSESLWNLVNRFARSGIKYIDGDINIVSTPFKHQFSVKKKGARAFMAQVKKASFNWNSLTLRVQSHLGSVAGQEGLKKAFLFLDPFPIPSIKIINQTRVTRGNMHTLKFNKRTLRKGDEFTMSGDIGVNATEQVFYNNISHPEIFLGEHFAQFLNNRGIVFRGKIKVIKKKKSFKNKYFLVEELSKPLVSIVSDMMKFSNNYVAEMLTHHFPKGLYSIKKQIKNLGISSQNYSLVNPSGLTPKNQFTSESLGKLLLQVQRAYYAPEWMSSLSVVGVDGTLKKILTLPKGVIIRAKTGLLSGAVSVAGFMHKDSRVIPFVFILNVHPRKTWQALQWRKKFLQFLVKNF